MNCGHARQQIVGHIANGIQLSVAGLSARVEVCELRDGSTAKNAYAQQPSFFVHGTNPG